MYLLCVSPNACTTFLLMKGLTLSNTIYNYISLLHKFRTTFKQLHGTLKELVHCRVQRVPSLLKVMETSWNLLR